MCSPTCCAKAVLIIVNTIFLLLGIVLLGGGIAAIVLGDTLQDIVDDLLVDLPSALSAVSGDAETTETTTGIIDVVGILKGIAIPLIVVGSILFLLAIFGCCGACCSSKPLLIIYTVLMTLLAVGTLVFVVLLRTGDGPIRFIRGQLEDELTKFKGISDFTQGSLIWNFLMLAMECCGIDGYEDFVNNAPDWDNTFVITVEGTDYTFAKVTPMACCKMDGDFPALTPLEANCSIVPSDINNNWKQGCIPKLQDQLSGYDGITIGVFAGLIVTEVVLAFLALLVACRGTSKVDD